MNIEDQTAIGAIEKMIAYWKSQNVFIESKGSAAISKREEELGIRFPGNFRLYLEKTNGTVDMDKEGFYFYPLDEIVPVDMEFEQSFLQDFEDCECLIIADYLTKCWWYGILYHKDNPDMFAFVIIPDNEHYKVITYSFESFVDFYIRDAGEMYDYGEVY